LIFRQHFSTIEGPGALLVGFRQARHHVSEESVEIRMHSVKQPGTFGPAIDYTESLWGARGTR
jgi:hypothetical protein